MSAIERITPPSDYYDRRLLNVPIEMRTVENWVCFDAFRDLLEEDPKKREKIKKMPRSARNPQRKGESNDPSTWATFGEAVACARAHGWWLGFAFEKSLGITAVDLDGSVDEFGEIVPAAQERIDLIRSYQELSISRTGTHGFVGANIPPFGRSDRSAGVEMYDDVHMFLVTGDVIPGYESFAHNQEGVSAVHAAVFGTEPEQRASPPSARPTSTYAGDDKDLLEKARKSRQGPAFTALYDRGDAGPYDGDQSAADLALCNMLAFWYGGDAFKIDAMFRDSALMRPKWDERHYSDGRTYGQATIAKALGTVRDRYDPTYRKEITEDQRKDWEIATLKESMKRSREREEAALAREQRALAREEAAISQNREMMATAYRNDVTAAMKIALQKIAPLMANLDQTEANVEGVQHRVSLQWVAEQTGLAASTVTRAVDLMANGMGYWVDAEGNRCDPDGAAEFVVVPLMRRHTEPHWVDDQRRSISFLERTPEAGATTADTFRAFNSLVPRDPPKPRTAKVVEDDEVVRETEEWRYWTIRRSDDDEVVERGRERIRKPTIAHGVVLADGNINWLGRDLAEAGPGNQGGEQIETDSIHADALLPTSGSVDIIYTINSQNHGGFQVPKTNSLGLPELFPPAPKKRRCAKCSRWAMPGLVYCVEHDYLLSGGPPPRRKEQPVAQARSDPAGRSAPTPPVRPG